MVANSRCLVEVRAVECWRDLKKDGGISFGHALGKLFQETFLYKTIQYNLNIILNLIM